MSQIEITIRTLLAESRTIAVVGLSPKSDRPSYGVDAYLQRHGYRIIPVNPAAAGTHILAEHCYATLTQAASSLAEENQTIDIVDCFRRPETIEPIADEAIAIGARCLWMQLGIHNEAAAAKARANGIDVIEDRCIKIDHANLAAREGR